MTLCELICAAVLAMYGGDIAIAAQNILSNSLGQALAGAAFARAGRRGSFERMPRGPLGSQCFGEGTSVETDDGLVPIESVAVGEFVWSRDEATGEEGYHEVVRTFVRSSPVMELEIPLNYFTGTRASDGATMIYHPTSNTFGVYRGGTPSTLFRPTDRAAYYFRNL